MPRLHRSDAWYVATPHVGQSEQPAYSELIDRAALTLDVGRRSFVRLLCGAARGSPEITQKCAGSAVTCMQVDCISSVIFLTRQNQSRDAACLGGF